MLRNAVLSISASSQASSPVRARHPTRN